MIKIDTSNKVALAKSIEEAFGGVQKNYDEVLERLGAAAGERDELKKGLADLKLVAEDATRVRVPVDGKAVRRLPMTKESLVQFGMKALHQCDSKNRVKAISKPWGVEFEIDEDDVVERAKAAADDIRLLGISMGIKEHGRLRGLKHFKSHYLPAQAEAAALVKEAFDIQTSGEGLEWLDVVMSEQLIEMVRISRRVAALFEEVPMLHGKITFPTWFVDLDAFKFAENTGDTGGTPIADGLGTKNVTSKWELEAVAAGVVATVSKFLEEDMAFAYLPWARRAVVEALNEGEEDWFINGDLTATHMDADVAAVTNHMAKMGYGLRYVGNKSANPARTSAGAGRIDSNAQVRDILLVAMGNMAEYGVDPERLALIEGANGNAQLLSVEAFQTAYAIGSGLATNVAGAIRFTPYGWRYAVSGKLRNNLAATGVNTSGTTARDKTGTILVNTKAWKIGRVREITLQLLDQTRALYDQNQLVATMRSAFGSPYGVDGTKPHTAFIYDQGL